MCPSVNIPRVRYDHIPRYSKAAGFYQLQYEMVFVADENVLENGAVKDAVLTYSQDVYRMEIFAADCLHQISACVDDESGESFWFRVIL